MHAENYLHTSVYMDGKGNSVDISDNDNIALALNTNLKIKKYNNVTK
jgi:hypothetical protein